MSKVNRQALELIEALQDWDRADNQLARVAGRFVADLISPHATRGAGTHAALERLKHHLGFDRYAMPAVVLEQLTSEQAAAIMLAAKRATN